MGLLDDAIREHLDLKRRSGGDPAEIERLEREALGPVRRDPTTAGGAATSVVAVEPEYELDDHEAAPADVAHAESVSELPPDPQPKRRGFLHRRPPAQEEPDSVADLDDDRTQIHEPAPLDHEPDPLDQPTVVHLMHDDELERDDDGPVQEGEPEPPRLSLAGDHEPDSPTVNHEDAPSSDASGSAEPVPATDDAPVRPAADFGFDDDDDGPAHEDEPEAADGEDDVLEETPEFLQDTPDHDRLWFEQRPPKDFDFDG